MIRWKGILATTTALGFAVNVAFTQTPDSTFERLRRATLEKQSVSETKASTHPLAPKAAPVKVETVNPAEAPVPEPPASDEQPSASLETAVPIPTAPVTTAEHVEIEKFERSTTTERPSVIMLTNHKTVTKPAVHTTESATEDETKLNQGNLVNAAYSKQQAETEAEAIVQINGTKPSAKLVTAETKVEVLNKIAISHSDIKVEWRPTGEIVVGEECSFDLVVKNTGGVDAQELEIDAYFPATVRLTAARPKPDQADDHLTWKIAKLPTGEEHVLSVKLIPSRRGDLELSSKVRFTGEAAGKFVVAEPMLEIAIDGPADVLIGEPASHTITISNPGTGTARNISLEALIPTGLKHPRGERLLLDVGTLEPGESRDVRLSLAAVEGGSQEIKLAANASNALRKISSSSIVVVAPSLAVDLDGPGLRYKGRKGTFNLLVHNDGTAISNNVRIRQKVPVGFEFVKTDEGGKFDPRTRTIDWFLGQMKPGEKKNIEVELMAAEFGEFTHEVAAASEHGAQALDELKTRIEGASALSLEIVDLDDPVEVGSGNAYEIRVTNDGSIGAGNVGIAFELPKGVEFVSADGPAKHQFENGVVFFQAVPNLEPEKTITYQIQVKGTNAGNHRFRARLASDSIREPLIFEELTKYYGE